MNSYISKLVNSSKVIGLAYNWKGAKIRDFPVIFQKPVSSIIQSGETVFIPQNSTILHESKFYLVELGFFISQKGKNIQKSEALNYVEGYCLILDITGASILDKAKVEGFSWDIGKGLDTFLPVSSFIPKRKIKDPHNLELYLSVNGEVKQQGNTKNLIFDIPSIIHHLSSVFTLNQGDLILTGTPPGALPIKDENILRGKLLQDNQVLTELIANVKVI